MKTLRQIANSASVLCILGMTLLTPNSLSAAGNGNLVQRDLQEWLDAQGTAFPGRPLAPDTPTIYGWVNNPDINGDGVPEGPSYVLWFDYAGVLSRASSTGGGALGPESLTGTVTERPLGDGLSEISVRLKIKGTLCWVFDRSTGNVVFGNFEPDVAAGAEPALADASFSVTYLQETGTPLMDLAQVVAAAGSDWKEYWPRFMFSLDARGPLSADFDPDVPAGTTGHLHWAKPGLQDSVANGNASNGAGALYPNDTFRIHAIPGQ